MPTSNSSEKLQKHLEACRNLLVTAFDEIFKSELLNHDSGQHFGVYTIKSRVKTDASLAAKQKPTLDKYQSISDSTFNETDIIGIRIVVETQSHKIRIVRALNNLSRYEVELPGSGIRICKAKDSHDRIFKWKYFNPPINYLYSAPQVLRELDNTLKEALKDYQNTDHDLGKQKNYLKTYVDHLQTIEAEIVRDGSGYATIQRVFKCEFKNEKPVGARFCYFELQVRTVLEDAWADPAHQIAYKGDCTQRTRDMLRNLGVQLAGADDLKQMIYDDWQERNTSYFVPYSPFTRSYDLRQAHAETLITGVPDFGDTLHLAYQQRRFGRFGNALRIIRELKERIEHQHRNKSMSIDAQGALHVLLLEEASSLMFFLDRPDFVNDAKKIYTDIARNIHVKDVYRFWAQFRLSFVAIRSAQLDPRTRVKEPEVTLAMMELVEAERILSTCENELGLAYDISELRADMYLWKAHLLKRKSEYKGKGKKEGSELNEALILCREAVADVLSRGITSHDRSASGKYSPHPRIRELETLKRSYNAMMFYEILILKQQGKSIRRDVAQMSLSKILLIFKDYLEVSKKLLEKHDPVKAAEYAKRELLRLEELISPETPQNANSWHITLIKRYDTYRELLALLAKYSMAFKIDGLDCEDLIIPIDQVKPSCDLLFDRIRTRLLTLAVRGELIYEFDLFGDYKCFPQ